jgi:LytS/YehU family sensor histidine kinase
MLKLKHNGALQINLDVSPGAREKGIAMVTLQMLIDNAIKHNTVHPKTPLIITIRDEEDFLTIHNNKQLRKQIELSTKQGLQQLRQLYGFYNKQPVMVVDEPFSFNVKLPLL